MLGKQHGTFLNVKKEKCLEHDFQEIESTTFTLFQRIANRSRDLIMQQVIVKFAHFKMS